jgi:hypothetical protein
MRLKPQERGVELKNESPNETGGQGIVEAHGLNDPAPGSRETT